ncbi:hypothetical protein HZB60_08445 [candidate division KSB1 bacterium]|nr:hypothetical protein [candidate division KSB1 bacterium]
MGSAFAAEPRVLAQPEPESQLSPHILWGAGGVRVFAHRELLAEQGLCPCRNPTPVVNQTRFRHTAAASNPAHHGPYLP